MAAFNALAADETFVQKAGAGGAYEIAAGHLAQTKGGSDGVKKLGTQLVDDHTKAADQLKSVAEGKKMTVPSDPDPAHQKVLASLDKLSGAGFDKAFKKQMVKDHMEDIALFKKESTAGKDADLKAYATSTLPTLEEHLHMAHSL
ncbi:MAG: DUF4142 domain-containing protein [Pseudomonadota bacterium]|nr:DUF4142 domain-containing protein [Pseudomonadota bacterium]